MPAVYEDRSSREYWDERARTITGDRELVYNDNARFKRQDEIARDILRMIVKSGNSVLDLGCGYGRFTALIKELGGDYTGMDFSEGMLGLAKERHPETKFIHASWHDTGACDPHLFDIVFESVCKSSFGQQYDNYFEKTLEKFVKPEGLVIMVEPEELRVWSPSRDIFI